MERDKSWIVYLHINRINKKVYVGITHHSNPNKRWRSGEGYRGAFFHNAISKYGWNAFSHIIFCRTSKPSACLLEQSLIHYYKSKGLSYNIGLGGEGSSSFSEETKDKLRKYTPWIKGRHHTKDALVKISKSSRERHLSEETKRKIGDANRGSRNGMFGKSVPPHIKKRISERFSKPVLQFDLDGNFISEFSSASEAEHILNVKGSHIGCCCLGKRKTAYGYKWKYKYE